jgi:uncharacterized protein (DUF885 family)
MLNRRQTLLCAAAAGLAPLSSAFAQITSPAAAAGSAPGEATRLHALFDDFMQRNLKRSPELATGLGLDKEALAPEKAMLDDRSLAQRARDKAENVRRQKVLATIDRRALQGADVLNHDTIAYVQDVQAEADQRFDYGGVGAGSPYVLSQLTGAYQQVPDFLDTQHSIAAKADADAYLARLEAFAHTLDQELEQVRHDADIGVVPPAFVIDRTLGQMKAFADTPADQATLVTSVARRAREKGIAGDYAGPAAALYTGKILPAVERQMALLASLRAHANPAPGVGALPAGEAYYGLSLKTWTTTNLAPAEVHRQGLEQVASLTSQLDAAFRAQGMSQGAVWERLRALFHDPRFLYPDTDAGKVKLIGDLNLKVKTVQARLPQWFGTLPKAGVEIRRVPPAIEAGASSNYQAGTLDGSRPGAYYIVLRDTAEDPSWLMPTLTYHEAIPGHHLQGSLQRESSLPLLLKTTWFSAYGEGWALYAEQLADEMGMYETDPFGHIGYLHDALLRAARMVMDTGLHAMGWSREQAIRYFVENQGDPDSSAISEVERYCVWPGQACSYMVGKLEWLRLRAKAKAALGPKFDIRRFHDAGLLAGALPLVVLDAAIDDYVQRGG